MGKVLGRFRRGLVGVIVSVLASAGIAAQGAETPTRSTYQMLYDTVFSKSCLSASCHVGTRKAGGLSLDTKDAYASLFDAHPTNTAARERGLKLVDPGKPMNSFLLLKLLSPAPDMGGVMPRGTTGLPPDQIKAVRQWIEAGAPRTGVVAGIANLSRDSVQKQAELKRPAAPKNGIQLYLKPFPVEPGTEREVFYSTKLPTTETVYVHRIEVFMRDGSHHFILYRVTEGNPPPGVFRDLNPKDPQELEMFKREYVIGSQQRDFTIQFPEGVALEVPAGSQYDMNSHYVNLNGVRTDTGELCTPEPILGEVYVNLHTIPKSRVRRLVQPIFDSNTDIEVPPGETRTTTQEWRPKKDVHVVMLAPHMHRHGTRFRVERLDGTPVYDTTEWHDPETLWHNPPLLVKAGDGLRHHVTHRNHDKTEPIRFGYTSEDEMAILFGYFFTE